MSRTKWLASFFAIGGLALVLGGLVLMVLSQDEPAATATVEPTAIVVTEEPTPINTIPLPDTISGLVKDGSDNILAGVSIQIQATTVTTETDENGRYTLSGIAGTTPIVVTAWRSGHYIGWATVNPSAPDWVGADNIDITLQRLPVGDNSTYEWFEFEGVRGSASCGLCHREYAEWQADAHSQTATNPRFLSMYSGTDINGQAGQRTQWTAEGIPLPPEPDEPYFGPGFRLDNYNRAGSCGTCHTPLASQAPNNQNCAWSGCHTDLTIERSNGLIPHPGSPLTRRASEGITCEFCHKISEVYIDDETQLPYPDMPGILSVRLHRPSDESEQVFFGTLIDVMRQDSYLPLLSESAFCSSCHYGVFGGVVGMERVAEGTVIYNSYGEWLESPYSDPETGITCQGCHMPESDAKWFVLEERDGLTRDYVTLHNHTMPGAYDATMLQNAVTMTTTAERTGNQIQVEVSITNDRTGHHVPTDAPIRSMILVVEAFDADGNVLELVEGSVNPDYSGDYGGIPGKTYAKVLRDDLTGEAPTAAFWRPVTIIEDTRLPAMATDTTNYTFAAPDGAVTVQVRLLYRRSFYELMNQKGWTDPDILMEEATVEIAN